MHFHSSSAKHKLFIAAILLALFIVPFAMQWASVRVLDSKAIMAGAGAIGNSAYSDDSTVPPSTNYAGQLGNVSGKSFIGVSAR